MEHICYWSINSFNYFYFLNETLTTLIRYMSLEERLFKSFDDQQKVEHEAKKLKK